MSRIVLLLVAALGLTSLAVSQRGTDPINDHIVQVRGVLVSFETGHERSFFLRNPAGLTIEIGVSPTTRVAIGDHHAKPRDLKVGMGMIVKGIPRPKHHAIQATLIHVRDANISN